LRVFGHRFSGLGPCGQGQDPRQSGARPSNLVYIYIYIYLLISKAGRIYKVLQGVSALVRVIKTGMGCRE